MKDIIVIGAGHAGVEAAHIADKLGLKVALVTFSMDDISHLPCNVSIGGSAKGIVVKELYALGGLMPFAADETQLQTKILNQSKGPAVRALRAQVDKVKYPQWVKNYLNNDTNIKIIEAEVVGLSIENDKVTGVTLKDGTHLSSKAVIITTGTFLRAKTMKGTEIIKEGPDGKESPQLLSEQLDELDVELIRLKTGTPPRIKTSTIDFSEMKIEPGSEKPIFFTTKKETNKEYQNEPAYLVYTNEDTHKIIRDNMEKSYLFSDEIVGAGPRYCPSIEDKVKRFADKSQHQIFLEIESEELDTTYMAGISSSLPKDVQEKFIRTIPGFKNSEFEKYAYAIEYDAINPTQLKQTLELKTLEGLYFAGQVNGTSGYEEAAAQGMWAGINASNKILGRKEFLLGRDEAYIGVMIDDITTKGIDDPYRLLSSRSEYRLLLRTDNAVNRLYETAFEHSLITEEKYNEQKEKFNILSIVKEKLWDARLKVEDKRFLKLLNEKEIQLSTASVPAETILKRPEFELHELTEIIQEQIPEMKNLTDDEINTLSVEVKFEGYILKQQREINKYKRLHTLKFPEGFDFNKIDNLAIEAREKLNKFKPNSVDQVSKIQGINPSDIMVLINYLNK